MTCARGRVFLGVTVLIVLGCSSTPSDRLVTEALQKKFGEIVRVDHVRRTNGVALPGGNGAPDQYNVQFEATLVPSGPVTFKISSGVESALLGKLLVKDVVKGHEPDRQGLAILFDIGTKVWRVDAAQPVNVTGAVRFVKTEQGWQNQELQTVLADSSVQIIQRQEEAERELKRKQAEAQAWYVEGVRLFKIGSDDQAVRYLRGAADVGHARAQNALAWLLATTPETRLLNGQAAVDYATKALAQAPTDWAYSHTLAAAYARLGKFEEASKLALKAFHQMEVSTNLSDGDTYRVYADVSRRVEVYGRHQMAYTDSDRVCPGC